MQHQKVMGIFDDHRGNARGHPTCAFRLKKWPGLREHCLAHAILTQKQEEKWSDPTVRETRFATATCQSRIWYQMPYYRGCSRVGGGNDEVSHHLLFQCSIHSDNLTRRPVLRTQILLARRPDIRPGQHDALAHQHVTSTKLFIVTPSS